MTSQQPYKLPRTFFYAFMRVFLFVFLGLNVRRKNLLPQSGPAIIVANHNSHLDTMVLMSLFPLKQLPGLRPVAAADHFLRNKFMAWFSLRLIGIVPINRSGKAGTDPLEPCYRALEEGKILIIFPEGSRGEPEQRSQFKRGISYLAEKYPQAPIVPVFMHGLGKALPKDESILVPFFCDIFVGEPIPPQGEREKFMQTLNERFDLLAREGDFKEWR